DYYCQVWDRYSEYIF
nr:immunoglobulin light chain junction region [Macaca mulatta]MOW36722.1 immunoglobulin light chain junction region [Macaca mulatta]